MSSRNSALAIFIIAIGFASPARAQNELEIAVSPSPVGSGARAMGMAGAFVAIADDATAASWNPAGLVQLERPEISIVGSTNGVDEQFEAMTSLHGKTRFDAWNADLNYLSFVYPLPHPVLGKNVVLALNYQRKYDFSREFDLEFDRVQAFQGLTLSQTTRFSFEQRGGLGTLTPALAFELTNRLSLGVSLNLWQSSLFGEDGWTQHSESESLYHANFVSGFSQLQLQRRTTDEKYSDFSGRNVVVGVLWNPTDRWAFAARYDSAFTGKVDYQSSSMTASYFMPDGADIPRLQFVHETRHVHFPETFALGAARRFGDRLTLSCDVTRTDWDSFTVTTAGGDPISLIDASNRAPILHPKPFKPTITARIGAEYVFIPKRPDETLSALWTLRGGLFCDEEPATRQPDAFGGVAIGAGVLLRQRYNIDFAYQLRMGNNVNHDYVRGIGGFREDVQQHLFLLSAVVYF